MLNRGIRAGLLVGLLVAACNKSDEAGKPAGVAPLVGSPPPAAAPTPPPAAPAPPAAQAPPAAAEPPPDPHASIEGQIVLPNARKGDVNASDTMFLVARRISDNPSARGSLLAVKKLAAGPFPMAFTISGADMPFQQGPFDGDVTITVRVDKDGNPMTHMKGDVFGIAPKVHVGARGVKIALDQLQKEDESLGQPGAPPPGAPMGLPPGHP